MAVVCNFKNLFNRNSLSYCDAEDITPSLIRYSVACSNFEHRIINLEVLMSIANIRLNFFEIHIFT